MNVDEYLLTCMAEECSEIGEQCLRMAVRVSKALRFGIDEVQRDQLKTNAERISDELADLIGVARLMHEAGLIDLDRKVESKRVKVEAFLEFSRKCGVIRD